MTPFPRTAHQSAARARRSNLIWREYKQAGGAYASPACLYLTNIIYRSIIVLVMMKKYLIYKKQGRLIHAPSVELKAHQRAFLPYLLAKYNPSEIAHAYIKSRSYISAAKVHIGAKMVLRLDIKKFFNSITFSQISKIASNDIAIAVCIDVDGKQVLVQGSPLSPILSNMALYTFDKVLLSICDSFNLRVTRYADDIVLSSTSVFPTQKLIKIISTLLKNLGFELNSGKTKISTGDFHTIYGITVGPNNIQPSRRLKRKAKSARGASLEGYTSLFGAIK